MNEPLQQHPLARIKQLASSRAWAKNNPERLKQQHRIYRDTPKARFRPGMTWENYGTGWVVDHRIPCAEFDLTDVSQQKQCFHYSNLQPLWKKENHIKSNRMPASHQAELL